MFGTRVPFMGLSPLPVHKLGRMRLYWVGVAVFYAATLFFISWTTTSIVITSNGYVKWEEGFERTVCSWRPGCEWDANDRPVATAGD